MVAPFLYYAVESKRPIQISGRFYTNQTCDTEQVHVTRAGRHLSVGRIAHEPALPEEPDASQQRVELRPCRVHVTRIPPVPAAVPGTRGSKDTQPLFEIGMIRTINYDYD